MKKNKDIFRRCQDFGLVCVFSRKFFVSYVISFVVSYTLLELSVMQLRRFDWVKERPRRPRSSTTPSSYIWTRHLASRFDSLNVIQLRKETKRRPFWIGDSRSMLSNVDFNVDSRLRLAVLSPSFALFALFESATLHVELKSNLICIWREKVPAPLAFLLTEMRFRLELAWTCQLSSSLNVPGALVVLSLFYTAPSLQKLIKIFRSRRPLPCFRGKRPFL